MSPLNRKKLNTIRKKLDKLDNELLKVIKKRSLLVNNVIKLKTNRSEIVDKKRIKSILKKIKFKSIQNKIDPIITKKIWTSMIWSYINFEKKNFKKKK
jgi:chorismate mutase